MKGYLMRVTTMLSLMVICVTMCIPALAADHLDEGLTTELKSTELATLTTDSLEAYFSKEDAKTLIEETNKMIVEQAEKGFKYIGSTISVSERPYSVNGTSTSNDPYYVEVQDHYTSKPKTINDSSHGMKYWLDVAWNVYLGATTKYTWVAATILGVEPSAFMSSWQKGDRLVNTTTNVYHRRCYKMYNEVQDRDEWYYETKKLVATEYVDCYTVDAAGNPYRDEKSQTFTRYTEHYFQSDWIDNYVRQACAMGLMTDIDRFA